MLSSNADTFLQIGLSENKKKIQATCISTRQTQYFMFVQVLETTFRMVDISDKNFLILLFLLIYPLHPQMRQLVN
jgi:hypothetical protein